VFLAPDAEHRMQRNNGSSYGLRFCKPAEIQTTGECVLLWGETADADQIRGNTLLRLANRDFIADRQLVTTLGATPSQDGTPIGGLHPNTKTVCFGALAVIGLKSTFGHFRSLSVIFVWGLLGGVTGLTHGHTAASPRNLNH
jgi:hypothetical protein